MDWSENTGMQRGIAWTNPDILWASPTIKTSNPVIVAFDRIILLWVFYRFHTTNTFTFCFFLYISVVFQVCSRQPVRKTTQERKHRSSRFSLYSPPSCQARLSVVYRWVADHLRIFHLAGTCHRLRVWTRRVHTECLVGHGGYPPFLTVYCTWCACLVRAMHPTYTSFFGNW